MVNMAVNDQGNNKVGAKSTVKPSNQAGNDEDIVVQVKASQSQYDLNNIPENESQVHDHQEEATKVKESDKPHGPGAEELSKLDLKELERLYIEEFAKQEDKENEIRDRLDSYFEVVDPTFAQNQD